MVTELKVGPNKLSFSRTDIRTMKKDIKALREADAISTRQTVTAAAPAPAAPHKIKINSPQDAIPTRITPTGDETAPTKEVQTTVKIVAPSSEVQKAGDLVTAQRAQHDDVAIAQAKQYATEEEKQRIFALESQAAQVQEKIKALGGDKNSSLALEKNQILIAETTQKKALEQLIKEEEKIEIQIKDIETTEAQTNVPEQRQGLEQQRAAKENQRQEIEKKRWAIEKEIESLKNKIQALDANYKKFGNEEGALKANLAQINTSLRQIYFDIIDRQKNKKEEVIPPAKPVSAPVMPKPAPAPEPNPRTTRAELSSNDEKPPVITPPAPVKPAPVVIKAEKIQIEADYPQTKGVEQSSNDERKVAPAKPAEDTKQRKFMEDVEAWLAEHNNTENKT